MPCSKCLCVICFHGNCNCIPKDTLQRADKPQEHITMLFWKSWRGNSKSCLLARASANRSLSESISSLWLCTGKWMGESRGQVLEIFQINLIYWPKSLLLTHHWPVPALRQDTARLQAPGLCLWVLSCHFYQDDNAYTQRDTRKWLARKQGLGLRSLMK